METLEYIKQIYELEQLRYKQERALSILRKDVSGERYRSLPKRQKVPSFGRNITGIGTLLCLLYILANGGINGKTVIAFLLGLVFLFLFIGMQGVYTKKSRRAARGYELDVMAVARANARLQDNTTFLNQLKSGHIQTINTLLKFYDLGIIPPRYRGLIPVSSIYDYLESGKCRTLDEAYQRYDYAKAMGLVSDTLPKNPNKVKENQHALWAALVGAGNVKSQRYSIADETARINLEATHKYSKWEKS